MCVHAYMFVCVYLGEHVVVHIGLKFCASLNLLYANVLVVPPSQLTWACMTTFDVATLSMVNMARCLAMPITL